MVCLSTTWLRLTTPETVPLFPFCANCSVFGKSSLCWSGNLMQLFNHQINLVPEMSGFSRQSRFMRSMTPRLSKFGISYIFRRQHQETFILEHPSTVNNSFFVDLSASVKMSPSKFNIVCGRSTESASTFTFLESLGLA